MSSVKYYDIFWLSIPLKIPLSSYLFFQDLSPVADQEDPDGWQEEQDEVGPVELVLNHGGREEVAEHDDKNDAGDHMDEHSKAEDVINFRGQGPEVGMQGPQNVQL